MFIVYVHYSPSSVYEKTVKKKHVRKAKQPVLCFLVASDVIHNITVHFENSIE